jgi:phage shock protein PspC (stress-responsive transcriptional regulator)
MTSATSPSTPILDGQSDQQQPPPAPAAAVRPHLRRSATDKMAGGVCGGLAEHTGIDSLVWRVGFVGLTLAGGAGILVYLLLWVLMPPAPRAADQQPNRAERLAEQVHHKVYATGWMPPRS